MAALTDAKCRALKPKEKLYKVSDSLGLQLWVYPNGSRLWRLAYRSMAKQKVLALGPYPEVSLATARDLRDEARQVCRAGKDPSEERRLQKRARATELTFGELADEYLSKLQLEGKAPATLKKAAWHIDHAKKAFGTQAVTAVTPVDVLEAARVFERRGNFETAHRFKGTIGCIFRHGIASSQCAADPTVGLRGALVSHKPVHRAAILDPNRFGPLLRAIDAYEETHRIVGTALKVLPLLFVRQGELRQAAWDEFNLVEGVWTVPATRTKMRRPHRVPLAPRVITTLLAHQQLKYSERLVFPSVRNNKVCISDGALNAALRAIGYPKEEITPHGFRAAYCIDHSDTAEGAVAFAAIIAKARLARKRRERR